MFSAWLSICLPCHILLCKGRQPICIHAGIQDEDSYCSTPAQLNPDGTMDSENSDQEIQDLPRSKRWVEQRAPETRVEQQGQETRHPPSAQLPGGLVACHLRVVFGNCRLKAQQDASRRDLKHSGCIIMTQAVP